MSSRQGTFILATAGTSLLNHLRKELGIKGFPSQQEALSLLRKVGPTSAAAGAEINSIEHLIKGPLLSSVETIPHIEVVFLVSDTEDGRWTGTLLEAYYRSVRGLKKVSVHVVEGLVPDDPQKFSRTGLPNLVLQSSKLLSQAEKQGFSRVINATPETLWET